MKCKAMGREDYCSYELSKKLKEKGFDWECHSFYLSPNKSRKEEFFSGYQARIIRNQTNAFHYAAPTLSQAQKWLREEKDIVIMVDACVNNRKFTGKWYYDITYVWSKGFVKNTGDGAFSSYESALSAAITKALELI